MRAARTFGVLIAVSMLSAVLMAQQPVAGPLAISGSPSSARYCVAGHAANVHSLGWVEAGTSYGIGFESDIPLLTAVSRLDLSSNQSTASYGSGDLAFTASSSGTMALLVNGNGRTGCYRFKTQVEPRQALTASSAAQAATRELLPHMLTKPAKSPVQTLAISGSASIGKQCLGGRGVARVNSIGRLEAGSNISVTFDADFDAKAGLVNVDLVNRNGTFSIDDDSGGNLNPQLDITTSHPGTLVLFVAGNNGATGCYRYRVDVTPAPGATPSPAPAPISPVPDSGPANFAGTWRGQISSTACFDDGVLNGVCAEFPRIATTLVLVLRQNGAAVTGTLQEEGVVTNVTGTVQGDRLVITGRGPFGSSFQASYEDWNTSLSGPDSMAGTFSIRNFPNASVSGSARWAMTLQGVFRN